MNLLHGCSRCFLIFATLALAHCGGDSEADRHFDTDQCNFLGLDDARRLSGLDLRKSDGRVAKGRPCIYESLDEPSYTVSVFVLPSRAKSAAQGFAELRQSGQDVGLETRDLAGVGEAAYYYLRRAEAQRVFDIVTPAATTVELRVHYEGRFVLASVTLPGSATDAEVLTRAQAIASQVLDQID